MRALVNRILVGGTLLTAGCAVAETAPPPVALEPAPADTMIAAAAAAPVVEVEEEPSLQERWGAPFAVSSSGRPLPRAPRDVVVVRAPEPAPAVRTAARDSAPATAAPARPAPSPAAARPVAATRTHRVEWGDTWYGIARQYGVAPRDLAAANPDVDPALLRSGTVLRIPQSAARGAARRTHTVGSGETLWGIARRYGVSTDALRKANQLRDDRVRLGQTLVIPQGEGQ